jgi:putative NADPH-quinone reductase
MAKNIVVILGHPDSQSFCAALANAYVRGAAGAEHSVRVFRLGEIAFDATLHHGYHLIQVLEPVLQEVQDAIVAADHLVIVYPNWWGSMPGLLKGFFDRVLVPGVAFRYRKDSPLWDKLLTGKSARVIITMDTPLWYYWLVFGRPGFTQIRRTILGFCGISPVGLTSIGPLRNSTPAWREAWLLRAQALGQRGK